ncbi:MAG TPA: Gfo/Idh/MocA family oxidoreductase [Jatrophihabitantaceae bacterium]|nr:Gfo/Idh/MocA family oxidoreductase [Jatrophihabitantaceae bacterium]
MSAPIRVALIGAGNMGSFHARVLAQSQRAELALVIDPDQEVAAPIAARYEADWAPELDETSSLDAVVVAAPTELHPSIGRRVLDSGLPLLIEKPIADDLAEVKALVALSANVDVPLMCGLLERFNPALLTAFAAATEPRHVMTRRHSPYVPHIKTGVSSDLLIHDVDVALRLAGAEPNMVRGSFGFVHPSSPPGSEDIAEALLGFDSGMLAAVSASRLSQYKVRSLSIAEVERLIEVDIVRNAVTIYRHVLNEADPDGLNYRQQTIIEIPALVSGREPLAAQLDHFLDLVDGKADADAERDTLLPPHRVVSQVRAQALNVLQSA